MSGDRDRARVRIPADIEREDRLLAGLTARQLVLLAVPAVVIWAGYLATRRLVPLPVYGALAAPIAMAAAALAVGRRDGLSLDRLVAHALRHTRQPRRLVPAPEGVEAVPAWLGAADGDPPPAPLDLPVKGVCEDGVIDLGSDGTALICRASTISFGLRTRDEQQGLVSAFGRWLNSLGASVELVIRAEPVDITGSVAELRQRALGLPHPALERAALAHAQFLVEQARRQDLLRRQVLVVLQDPLGASGGVAGLRRRAEEAAAALAAAGVTLTVLDAQAAGNSLAAALDPSFPSAPVARTFAEAPVLGAVG